MACTLVAATFPSSLLLRRALSTTCIHCTLLQPPRVQNSFLHAPAFFCLVESRALLPPHTDLVAAASSLFMARRALTSCFSSLAMRLGCCKHVSALRTSSVAQLIRVCGSVVCTHMGRARCVSLHAVLSTPRVCC